MRAFSFWLLLTTLITNLASADVGQPKIDPRDEHFIEVWDRLRGQYSSALDKNKKEAHELVEASAKRASEAIEKSQKAALDMVKDGLKGLPAAATRNTEKATKQASKQVQDLKEYLDQQDVFLTEIMSENPRLAELAKKNVDLQKNIAALDTYVAADLAARKEQRHLLALAASQALETNAFLEAAKKAGERREAARAEAARAEAARRQAAARQQAREHEPHGGGDRPQREAPQREAPQREAPQREAPQREAPQREAPQRDVPVRSPP